MPNNLFAILLGILALYAVYGAVRAETGRRRTGWLVLAAGAVGQAANLVTGYSLVMAIVTTGAMVVGFWMARSPLQPTRPG